MGKNLNFTTFILLVCLFYVILHRFFYIGDYAATYDQVDFALSLYRFDLAMMQPHFPGYPYFVLGGMLLNTWVEDPVSALVIFNKLMFSLAAIPMVLIARRYFEPTLCFLAVLFWQTTPYLNVLTSLAMSEAAAISLLWWLLWSVLVALENDKFRYQLLPPIFFGLLLGIRLSYIAFGLLVVLAWVLYWRRNPAVNKGWCLFVFISITILSQMIWVGALIASEGSLQGFVKLAFSFTGGHFTEWGGAITETSMPLIDRFVTLLNQNIFSVGVAAESKILKVSIIALVLMFIFKRYNFNYEKKAFYLLWLGSSIGYFLWALFAQNIEKPRHIAPIIMFLLFWLSLKINTIKCKSWLAFVFLFLIVFQFLLGNQLMNEQEQTIPATYQLVNFLESKEEEFVVFAWEETRIMEYLDVNFTYQKILTYELFLQHIEIFEDHKIYLTDHVIEGFEKQGINVDQFIRQEEVFLSNEIFDPDYHNIILYEWKR